MVGIGDILGRWHLPGAEVRPPPPRMTFTYDRIDMVLRSCAQKMINPCKL